MDFLRKSKPLFIEDSWLPVWLSKFAPIKIYAICLGPIVFARGHASPKLRRHETIHWQQMIDLLIIGHLLLYGWDWFVGYVKYRHDWKGYDSPSNKAYYHTRAEQEAYLCAPSKDYLIRRKRWEWLWKYCV
jgi:hypothetical protein